MHVSVIAQIFSRLFALKWLLGSLAFVISNVLTIPPEFLFSRSSLVSFLPTAVYFLGAAVLWFGGPAISLALTKDVDASLDLGSVTQEQLFSVVLFGLGVYFALDYLGVFLHAMFFLTDPANRANPESYSGGTNELTNVIVTFLGGILLAWNCRNIARKFPVIKSPPASGHR